MTDDMIALARRAVACPRWRWMPGMRTYGRFLLVAQHERDGWLGVLPNDTSGVLFRVAPDATPDLTDPATLGCLLALVREAHGAPSVTFDGRTYPSVLHVVCSSGMYYVKRDCGDGDEDLYEDGVWSQDYRSDAYSIERTSEAEALVAALEAAP